MPYSCAKPAHHLFSDYWSLAVGGGGVYCLGVGWWKTPRGWSCCCWLLWQDVWVGGGGLRGGDWRRQKAEVAFAGCCDRVWWWLKTSRGWRPDCSCRTSPQTSCWTVSRNLRRRFHPSMCSDPPKLVWPTVSCFTVEIYTCLDQWEWRITEC